MLYAFLSVEAPWIHTPFRSGPWTSCSPLATAAFQLRAPFRLTVAFRLCVLRRLAVAFCVRILSRHMLPDPTHWALRRRLSQPPPASPTPVVPLARAGVVPTAGSAALLLVRAHQRLRIRLPLCPRLWVCMRAQDYRGFRGCHDLQGGQVSRPMLTLPLLPPGFCMQIRRLPALKVMGFVACCLVTG